MKKQEIKKDVIRDNIVGAANYMSNNTSTIWTFIGIAVVLISVVTIFSNRNKSTLLDSNLKMGILQNKAINNLSGSDSLLLDDYREIMNNPITNHDYNQAFIYVLSNAVKEDDKDYILDLLADNKFSDDDDMFNSFIYIVQANYLFIDDANSYVKFYRKAIDRVPSYDLKIEWSGDLVDFYLNSNDIDKAKEVISMLNKEIDIDDDLSRSAKDTFDFMESKVNQLIN